MIIRGINGIYSHPWTAAAEDDLNLSDNSKENFEEFRAQITQSIDALELDFEHYEDEETGKPMYAMVSMTLQDGLAKLTSPRSTKRAMR